MMNERKKQTLYEGASVLLISTVLAKIISAIFRIPLSSNACLGDIGFGYFSAAHDFFTPFHMMAISGFSVAVSKVVADYTAVNGFKDAEKAFKLSRKLLLWFSIAFAIILAIVIVPFVKATDITGQSIYSYFAMIPCVIFCFIASAYRGYYEGLGNMNPAAVTNIIEALAKLVLGFGSALIVVKITNNFAFAAAAATLGITFGALLSLIYFYIKYKVSGGITNAELKKSTPQKKDNEIIKSLVLVSIPIVLSSVASSVVTLVDAITVRWQLSGEIMSLARFYPEFVMNLEELPTLLYGIRSKAFTLYNLVPTLTMVVGVGAIPVLAEAFNKNETEELKEGIGSVFKLSALITLPAAAGFISLGERIMALLFGADASSQIGGKMLSLFGIALIFSGIAIPLGSCLQALNLQNRALVNVAIGIGVKIILNLWLCSIPEINVFGSVYATVACYAVILVLHLLTLIMAYGKLKDLKNILLKPLLASILCSVTAFLVSQLSLNSIVTVLSIVLGAMVYFAILIATKAFNDEDILAFPMGEKLLKIAKKLKFLKKSDKN